MGIEQRKASKAKAFNSSHRGKITIPLRCIKSKRFAADVLSKVVRVPSVGDDAVMRAKVFRSDIVLEYRSYPKTKINSCHIIYIYEYIYI